MTYSLFHESGKLGRRSFLRLSAMLPAASAALLSACGAGQEVLPGGGGTGDVPPPSPGNITNPGTGVPPAGGAFGALIQVSPLQLSGMTWTLAANANVVIDDLDETSLQPGMIARVAGGLEAGQVSGMANDVLVRPALRGPIESLLDGGFLLGGVRVMTSAQTVGGAGLSLGSLRPSDVVQVHGHFHPAAVGGAQLLATRVVRSTLRPTVQTTTGLFRANAAQVAGGIGLNGLAINTGSAVFASGLPNTLRDGALIQVSFERGADGGRRALQIAPVLPPLLADSMVRIQGFIYTDGATPDLRIADIALDLPTSISRASLEGRLVTARGLYRAGRLVVFAAE